MKYILVISFLIYSLPGRSQVDPVKPHALGINLFLNKFTGTGDVSKPGLSLIYLKGESKHIDIISTASASFLDYPYKNRVAFNQKNLLIELAIAGNFKWVDDSHFLAPYLTLGTGVSKYKNFYGIFLPTGAGFQASFKQEQYLFAEAQYRFGLNGNVTSHFYFSLGLASNLTKKKRTKAIKKPIIPTGQNIVQPALIDRDGDAILDVNDRCPLVAGPAILGGCPDSDGDNIADVDDKCPLMAGIIRYLGCPIPDTDNDGINDEADRCILNPGPLTNKGCPVITSTIIETINLAAKNILFETGSAVLLRTSFPHLDEISVLLKDNPTFKVIIEGHTDNKGNPGKNKILSNNRAQSVLNYFLNKGIVGARMTAIGYGQEMPVADNTNESGRQKNRRVEMKVRY